MRLVSAFLLVLFSFNFVHASGDSCKLWDELQDGDTPDSKTIEKLKKSLPAKIPNRTTFTKKSKPQVRKIRSQKAVYKKYNQFVELAEKKTFNELMDELKSTGSWKFKQYSGGNKGTYTIRLNRGNRVRFEPRHDGGIRILEIGKNIEGH